MLWFPIDHSLNRPEAAYLYQESAQMEEIEDDVTAESESALNLFPEQL